MNSISDSIDYKEFCKLASQNELTFSQFKINPVYNGILEHVSYEQGLVYLEYLNKNYPEFNQKIQLFKKNDLYGSPIVHNYDGVGEISPTTLRYIKVLSDIKKLFGDLNGKKIVEIGVGYGGQCLVLNQFFDIQDYTLVDLDEALLLSSKYLNKFGVNHRTLRMDELANLNEEFDLVISNYAYSEISRSLQDLYYDKLIKTSKNGYFTFNFISELFDIDSYSYESIMTKFSEKSVKVMSEYPETFENNKILYFNHQETYSQVNQDLWVLEMTKNKKSGYFLDIGAYDGVKFSNTYLLEKHYDWKGLLVEAQPNTFLSLEKNRHNKCLKYAISDSTGEVLFDEESYTGSKISNQTGTIVNSITFRDLFSIYEVPKIIDYMSLDIEGHEYKSLLEFPFEEYICNLITVEHNLYLYGPGNKSRIKELLTSNGYLIYKENISCDGNPFEDWYVHSSFLENKKIIFDIGSHNGLFTEECKKRYPSAKIVAVEANESLWSNIHLKYEYDPQVVALHYLVSDKTADWKIFHISDHDQISTASEDWMENSRFAGYNFDNKVGTVTVNLDSLIKIFGIPDLVKIDVEGYEFEVVSGLSQKVGEICFEWAEEQYEKINLTCQRLKDLGYNNFGYILGDEYLKRPDNFTSWEESDFHKIVNPENKDKWGMIWVN